MLLLLLLLLLLPLLRLLLLLLLPCGLDFIQVGSSMRAPDFIYPSLVSSHHRGPDFIRLGSRCGRLAFI